MNRVWVKFLKEYYQKVNSMIIDHGIEISFVMEVKECLKQTIGIHKKEGKD